MSNKQYRLRFGLPLPQQVDVGYLDINSDLTTFQIQSDIQGGFQSMSVGLDLSRGTGNPLRNVPRVTVDPQIEGMYHVEAWRGQQLCWAGRISKVDTIGDHVVGFTAKGYGVWGATDGVYFAPATAPVNTTLLTSGAVLQSVVRTAAPLLQIGSGNQFQDPGVQHSFSEADQKSANQVIDQFTQEATTAGVIVDYYVYESRTIYLIPRVIPAQPTYQIPLNLTVPISRVFDDLIGTVYVSYTDATTGQKAAAPVSATDPTFAIRYPGLVREKLVQGGTMTKSGAQAFANGYISLYSQPAYTCTIGRKSGDGLERYVGGEQFPELVRPGEWVQIGEPLPPGHPASVPPLIVVRTNYSADADTLTAELGARGPNSSNMLLELRRVAGATKNGINPVTRAAAA